VREILKVIVLVVGLCVLVLATPERIGRLEFSPDELKYRKATDWDSLFLGRTIWRTTEEAHTTPLLAYLHENGFVPEKREGPARWHSVMGAGWWTQCEIGSARVLFLAIHDLDQDDQWLKWSEANPEHAKKLWSLFVKLVREERYGTAATVAKYGTLGLPEPDGYDEYLAGVLAVAVKHAPESERPAPPKTGPDAPEAER